jgi:hypothetical protein
MPGYRQQALSLAQIRRADADLDDPGFVDAGNPYVFENLVVDFARSRCSSYKKASPIEIS